MNASKKTNCLLASTSTLHGESYLAYLLPQLNVFFEEADEVLFLPYARPSGISHDAYTDKVQSAFASIGKKCRGLHTFENPQKALQEAQGIFTGGGNTFLLLSKLYELSLISALKEKIYAGTPYLGTSAGSNIAGLSIQTTNDMPIVYPPSFEALGIIPFCINPHYLDANDAIKHMGETRETRIKEFMFVNNIPVIGLREGSWLEVKKDKILLMGTLNAKLFYKNAVEEVCSSFDFSIL